MSAEQKLDAVQFWNIMSEKLQEIVNHSAADIGALALEKDNKKVYFKAIKGCNQGLYLTILLRIPNYLKGKKA